MSSGKSFKHVLRISASAVATRLRGSSRQQQQQRAGKAESGAAGPGALDKPLIVIVPSAATSMVTIDNVADLLCAGKYVSPAQKRRQGLRAKAPVTLQNPQVTVTDPVSNAKIVMPANFQVFNSVTNIRRSDWDRVVAVFAAGKAYQFKDWPTKYFANRPDTVFRRARGFYAHYEDAPLDPEAKKWDVRRLSISRDKRHLDQFVMQDFWTQLGVFLHRKRPELMPAQV